MRAQFLQLGHVLMLRHDGVNVGSVHAPGITGRWQRPGNHGWRYAGRTEALPGMSSNSMPLVSRILRSTNGIDAIAKTVKMV